MGHWPIPTLRQTSPQRGLTTKTLVPCAAGLYGNPERFRNAELVILRTAAHARNWYEWASHVERGLSSDLSLVEIKRVIEGPSHDDWSESDALLLQSVDELASNGALGPELLEKLDAHIGQKAILDLIAVRSMYVMLGNMLNTWEVELDKHVAAALPDSVTRDNFENQR